MPQPESAPLSTPGIDIYNIEISPEHKIIQIRESIATLEDEIKDYKKDLAFERKQESRLFQGLNKGTQQEQAEKVRVYQAAQQRIKKYEELIRFKQEELNDKQQALAILTREKEQKLAA